MQTDKIALAQTSTDLEELDRLSNDSSYVVRYNVALNRKTSKEALDRCYVAGNINTSKEILNRLSKDNNYYVRSNVAKKPNTLKHTSNNILLDFMIAKWII